VATLGIALALYFSHVAVQKADQLAAQAQHSAQQAQIEARISCIRSKEFALPIGRFFQHNHVFTPAEAHAYFTLFPKKCG
jgi:hypothetical protein